MHAAAPIAALAAGLLLLVAGPALACTCAPETTAAEQLDGADQAFVGRVLHSRIGRAGEGRTVFRVEEALKGGGRGNVAVSHPTDGPTCGVRYRKGDRLLVLAVRDGRTLGTNLCLLPRHPLEEFRAAAKR